MSYPVYPETLPLPQADQYSYTPGNNTLESPMASGATRSRQLTTAVEDELNVVFYFSDWEQALFEGWFKHYAANGDNWVQMKIKVGEGVSEHLVKFLTPHGPVQAVEGGNFSKQCRLKLKNRSVLEKEITDFLSNDSLVAIEDAALNCEKVEL